MIKESHRTGKDDGHQMSSSRKVFLYFFTLGFINIGGPVAQITMMYNHMVERHHWLTEDRFVKIMAFCHPSKQPFLSEDFIAPGTFIAAVGADNPDKQELEPALLARNKLVVDLLAQCATIGELHHAIDAGVITSEDVYAELGEVIAGLKPGRTSSDEIIIFDSNGMALQDVVTAAAVYERAIKQGTGTLMNFAR